jgi:hypothetical protein
VQDYLHSSDPINGGLRQGLSMRGEKTAGKRIHRVPVFGSNYHTVLLVDCVDSPKVGMRRVQTFWYP